MQAAAAEVAPISRAKGTGGESGIVKRRSLKESPCGGRTQASWAAASAALWELGQRVPGGRGGWWLAGTSPAGPPEGAAAELKK